MRRLARVLVFVAGLSTLTTPVYADDDPFWGPDKALHFAASATIAAGGYAVSTAFVDARAHALLIGGGAAALAGLGKEALDLAGYGDPSWKDLAWDGIGIVCGLGLAFGLDLLVRGVDRSHPAFGSPRESALAPSTIHFSF